MNALSPQKRRSLVKLADDYKLSIPLLFKVIRFDFKNLTRSAPQSFHLHSFACQKPAPSASAIPTPPAYQALLNSQDPLKTPRAAPSFKQAGRVQVDSLILVRKLNCSGKARSIACNLNQHVHSATSIEPQTFSKSETDSRLADRPHRADPSGFSRKLLKPTPQKSIINKSPTMFTASKEFVTDSKTGLRKSILKKKLQLSAGYYIAVDARTGVVLASQRATFSVQVASLTKILTCYCVLQLSKSYTLDLSKQHMKVSMRAQNMIGTSADIMCGQVYSVQQLLYGLMLPSGNDAAVALAEWGGKVLYEGVKQPKSELVKRFVKYMNETSLNAGMHNSFWNNPHGLPDPRNCSSAGDMAKLTLLALKDQQFRQVVRTQAYEFKTTNAEGAEVAIRWQNTNYLLGKKGYIGVKTGYTNTAGSCLVACHQIAEQTVILVLLRCKGKEKKFSQADSLLRLVLGKAKYRPKVAT